MFGEITLEKGLENKKYIRRTSSSHKRKQLPYVEIVVALTRKGKAVHTK